MDFKEFWSEFYNNNLNRRLSVIQNTGYPINYDMWNWKEGRFLNLVEMNRHNNNLYASLTYVIGNQNYKDVDKQYRYTDRLFFDFDVEDSLKFETTEELEDLLIESELLNKPFKDMLKVYDYFKSKNINSYPLFSGSKGFHLYIFLEPSTIPAINYATIRLGTRLEKELNLTTLDFAPLKDPISRIARVPFSLNEKTNLYCCPINPTDDFKTILKKSKKPEPTEFNFNEYKAPADFTKQLHILAIREKDKVEQKKHQNIHRNTSYNNSNSSTENIDLINIVTSYLGSPERQYNGYVMFKCPFHYDNKPSMWVNTKAFGCYSCEEKGNYYDFIKQIEEKDLTDFEIVEIAKNRS